MKKKNQSLWFVITVHVIHIADRINLDKALCGKAIPQDDVTGYYKIGNNTVYRNTIDCKKCFDKLTK